MTKGRYVKASCAAFFFNDTATTEIYTLSLHDALPISRTWPCTVPSEKCAERVSFRPLSKNARVMEHCRSEEHTSELQSHLNLVCRLLLEKKRRKRKVAKEAILELRTDRSNLIICRYPS